MIKTEIMIKITSILSLKKKGILLAYLFIFSFPITENVFSRQNWKQSYTNVKYSHIDHAVIITFEVFDYVFGPAAENGYLRCCDFSYSTDKKNYIPLFRAETNDQKWARWTWLKMRYKRAGAKIQFLGCYKPGNGTLWPDNDNDVHVEVHNQHIGVYYTGIALFSVKWYLDTPGTDYKDAISIRLKGFWKVNGVYIGDDINDVTYDIPVKFQYQSNNNTVKVLQEVDAVVVKGVEPGENIQVYNTSGVNILSMVANSDLVRIQLTKNQIYIVNVGQVRYKVAL